MLLLVALPPAWPCSAQHGRDLFELLAAADVALYRAKGAGRDQVRVYAHATGSASPARQGDEATGMCP